MIRELVIEVEGAPVERARADVVAVPLFGGERPLRGAAGRADWRLCGQLSRLLADERIAGRPGEAALVSSFGGLRAPLLLVLGAGARTSFDPAAFESLAREAVRRALALRAGTLALAGFEEPEGGSAHERRAAALLAGAAAAVGAAAAPLELRLRLLVPREETTRSADLLRRARPGPIPEAVALRLPVASARRGGPGPASLGTPGARN